MAYLTKQIADTLCTAVALGYIATEGSGINIQYGDDADKDDYESIQSGCKKLGVAFDISESQSKVPYIIAKTNRVTSTNVAEWTTADYWKYVTAINDAANSLKPPPYGAYIGGMSTISSLFIVGPSTLDLYTPVFRAADDTNVSKSYGNAVTAANNALSCVKKNTPTATPKGLTLNFDNLNASITTKFKNGSLFKSYHGMIQTIVTYQTSIDPNSFIFEIALGSNTTKVSSCLPCSMFMTANERPPTATHLGRGDNWNIPSACGKGLRATWAANIALYYAKGKEILADVASASNDFKTLVSNGAEKQIDAVFLEALTFESKFTDKIKSTLGLS